MHISTESIETLCNIDVSDGIKNKIVAMPADITIVSSGVKILPFYSELGILLIDVDYLAPFTHTEDLLYYVRTTSNGAPYLCITKGLLFAAAITPCAITEKMITDIDALLNSLISGLALQKQIEANRHITYKQDESNIDIFNDTE